MPVIDPTKNVLDLVAAQEKSRNALRDSDQKLLAAELHRIAQLSEAETARIDQLRAQDARYGAIMEGMRNDKIDSTAKLLASQLQEIKGDIQVELRSTFGRVFTHTLYWSLAAKGDEVAPQAGAARRSHLQVLRDAVDLGRRLEPS